MLVDQLSSCFTQLKDQCYAADLITYEESKENFGGRGVTPTQETSMLFDIVLTKLRADPLLYFTFMELGVLQDPAHRNLVERIGNFIVLSVSELDLIYH